MRKEKAQQTGTFAGSTVVAVELPAVKTNGAAVMVLGEEAASALDLNIALDVGVLGVGVLGMATAGILGARVIGSPSKALGTPNVLAGAGAGGLEAGGGEEWCLEGVEVGRVKAAAAALALPRGVFLGVTPLRNTCTRANSWEESHTPTETMKRAVVQRTTR